MLREHTRGLGQGILRAKALLLYIYRALIYIYRGFNPHMPFRFLMKSPPPWVRGLLVEDSGKAELVRER